MDEGGVGELQRAHTAALARVLAHPRVTEMREFVARNLPVIGSSPALSLQQALCEPVGTRPRIHAEELLKTASRPEMTVRFSQVSCSNTPNTTATAVLAAIDQC